MSSSKGFGRACPTCGRSQYTHPDGKINQRAFYNDGGDLISFSRGCDLRLVSRESMEDARTGEIIYLKGYAPDKPWPRTKRDPRSWKHVTNLSA